MKRILPAFLPLLLLVAACQQAPVEYVHSVDTLYIRDTLHVPDTNALKLKGRLHGKALLYDFGGYAPNHSGITVHFDSTPYSTVTGDSGRWTMDSLPTGTYDMVFSKEGYGTYWLFGVQFVGGGDVYMPTLQQVALPLIPMTTFSDIKASRVVSHGHYKVYHIDGILPAPFKGTAARIYCGRDSTVSSDPMHYTFVAFGRVDTLTGALDAGFTDDLAPPYGLIRGERYYMAVYPVASMYGFSYWNARLDQGVEIGLGPRSEVVSLIIP
jgi:hypothetical protein